MTHQKPAWLCASHPSHTHSWRRATPKCSGNQTPKCKGSTHQNVKDQLTKTLHGFAKCLTILLSIEGLERHQGRVLLHRLRLHLDFLIQLLLRLCLHCLHKPLARCNKVSSPWLNDCHRPLPAATRSHHHGYMTVSNLARCNKVLSLWLHDCFKPCSL